MKQCYVLTDAHGDIICARKDKVAALETAKRLEIELGYDGKEKRVEV